MRHKDIENLFTEKPSVVVPKNHNVSLVVLPLEMNRHLNFFVFVIIYVFKYTNDNIYKN